MTTDRPANYLASLGHELRALPRETEWVEFKVNEAEPQAIGEYISALANAARIRSYLTTGQHHGRARGDA